MYKWLQRLRIWLRMFQRQHDICRRVRRTGRMVWSSGRHRDKKAPSDCFYDFE